MLVLVFQDFPDSLDFLESETNIKKKNPLKCLYIKKKYYLCTAFPRNR